MSMAMNFSLIHNIFYYNQWRQIIQDLTKRGGGADSFPTIIHTTAGTVIHFYAPVVSGGMLPQKN